MRILNPDQQQRKKNATLYCLRSVEQNISVKKLPQLKIEPGTSCDILLTELTWEVWNI